MALLGEYSTQELLEGQVQLLHQSLGFFKSVAMLVAVDLRIADAIHRLGDAATLPKIMAEAGINPCRLRDLRRIMRVLTVSGIFSTAVQQPAPAAEGAVYKLTPASSLLVVGETSQQLHSSLSLQVQFFAGACDGSKISRGMRAWFQQQDEQQVQAGMSPFALGCAGLTIFERAESDAEAFQFNDAMASDTAFLMPIALRECGEEVFGGLTSLIDVGGGLGGAAATIAAAFPDLKCSVLDLPQVVAKAPKPSGAGTNNVQYVAGDMFQSIPPADAVFLKWILHDWNDDECVKILKNCKQAIPSRAAGGKVIIVDMVVGYENSSNVRHLETQVLFDLLIMSINGVERDENEWKKIFLEAGFKDYKIISVLGIRSIIELYP